jgi:hypothetical protein
MFSVGPLDVIAAGLLALRRYGLGPTMLGALGLAIAVQPLLPPVPCDAMQPLFRRCQPFAVEHEDALRADLRNLASAQAMHLAVHGRFANDPHHLGFAASEGVTIEMVGDENGWAARATLAESADAEGCAIRWGDAPGDALGLSESGIGGHIVCADRRTGLAAER